MSGVLIYTTRDGDRWDTIAHKHYGNAFEIARLIAANPHLPLTEQFKSGLTVFVPVLDSKPKNSQEQLPPWMR
ncbi:tail protein X [Kingella kingae]|uniref:tail protein X n=1 Tax=Kingella kingae TaxID=504 RepID=UPI00254E9EE5|nr:tail protein X [Kingella kingae]MDK4529009.1 tail protein X [Kingella kingae]MDK4543699.1 tail protein X [Kingella kingae]MDK4562748.1 tail protein X [Kingella kingae]MDK4563903.1 tail protein X [Kingella kingae]MDK4578765.1 tail protein X [Kingella kingae]